uniref:TGB1 n=1 Tax=Lily virus X TaxID=12194 RepID=A0A482N7J4_LVX|nr:TGB1 [Lily virus X]
MEFYTGILNINPRLRRTHVPLSIPIVVHTVAGHGKTTLVRQILAQKPDVIARTYGRPDPPHLTGVGILGPEGDAHIVDEYPAGDLSKHPSAILILADPLQHRRPSRPAHYISEETARFGTETCKLLSTLSIHCTSTHSDQVQEHDIFSFEPEGVIISLGQEATDLLRAHKAEFLLPCQTLGETFDTVTLVTDRPLQEQDPIDAYIAVTRHRKVLHILH